MAIRQIDFVTSFGNRLEKPSSDAEQLPKVALRNQRIPVFSFTQKVQNKVGELDTS